VCSIDRWPATWDGTETIAPLRTVAKIHATGAELRNCLFSDEQSLSAVLGQCCYYRVSGRYGPAVVSVAFDSLLGAWRIDSYRGPANAHLNITEAAARLEHQAGGLVMKVRRPECDVQPSKPSSR
jgi:hypothetical protein